MSTEKLVCLAEIVAPHGIKGDVKVKTITDEPENLNYYSPLVDKDRLHQFHIESLKVTAKGVIIHFKGIENRTAAEKLKGLCLYAERQHLPPTKLGQYYHVDLLDMMVLNEKGEILGKITAVHNFGAGDIIEFINSENKPVCIPFSKDFVADVNLQTRAIIVKSVEGFY